MKYLFSILILLNFFACNPKLKKAHDTNLEASDTLTLLYAKGFDIVLHADYKEVIVHNPWQEGFVLARYFLVSNPSVDVPEQGVKVIVPVQSLAATSSTHFEFLNLLNVLDCVVGVCSPELIYNKFLREKLALGKLENLGDAFNINLEKTLKLSPEIVMMSGFKQDDPYADRVMQAGLPVVYNNEWMEHSLLARAEWIKFVAAFFNESDRADAVFSAINQQYLDAKSLVQQVKNKPDILTGSSFRGTWYMPGGQSFMSQLYGDAGASYFYADDTSKGSLPLNIETVLVNFSDADIWLNCNYDSYADLIQADDKHRLFKSFKHKQVYNFNKRKLASGANDYWESAVARPDLLLLDVVAILHPELLPNYELTFAEPLH